MRAHPSFPFRSLLCAALVLALCAMGACARPARPTRPFAYADGAFSVTVTGTFTPPDGIPRPIAAAVSVAAPTEAGAPASGARDLTVSFSAPSSPAGITVSRQGGAVSVTGIPFADGLVGGRPAAGFAPLLRFGDALLPRGDVSAVSPTENGLFTVTVTAEEYAAQFTFAVGEPIPRSVTVETPAERLSLTVTPII